jgi:hypothetical protein
MVQHRINRKRQSNDGFFLEAKVFSAYGAQQQCPKNRRLESLDDATVKNATNSSPSTSVCSSVWLANQITVIPTN